MLYDSHLNISSNADFIISEGNAHLFLFWQLKILGMDTEGIKTFILCLVLLLSKKDQDCLESVYHAATHFITTNAKYAAALVALRLPKLSLAKDILVKLPQI